jgi:hypothetical protein
MSKDENVATGDIKRGWLNPIRAAQAACKNNNGYGIVNLTVLVSKNEPVFWLEPYLTKVHPASLANVVLSPTLLGLLVGMTKDVDNNKDGTVE